MNLPLRKNAIAAAIMLLCMSILPASAQTYRLFVVVSTAAKQYVDNTGINLKQYIADNIISRTNESYLHSYAPANVQLAGVMIQNFTETSDISSDLDMLSSWLNNPSHPVTIRAKECAADAAMLVVYRTHGYTGVGYPHSSDLSTAISCVLVNYIQNYLVAPHELGHNFGCEHDTISYPGTYPFPFGHAFSAQDWSTIMFSYGGTKNFYSNPESTYNNIPRGTIDKCNNTRVVTIRADTMAGLTNPQNNLTLANKVWKSKEFTDVQANTSITANANDTVKDTSELWLRSTGSVTINSGFYVSRKGNLTVRAGAGALGKVQGQKNPLPPADRPVVSSQPEKATISFIYIHNALMVDYQLQKAASMSMMVFNAAGKMLISESIGYQRPGRHVRRIPLDRSFGGTIIVRITANGRRIAEKSIAFYQK
jgi:hypothetical protein